MQSFQTRVLETIAAAAEAHGAEVSQSCDFSNTGALNLHFAGKVAPDIVVRYGFQPSALLGLSRRRTRPRVRQAQRS